MTKAWDCAATGAPDALLGPASHPALRGPYACLPCGVIVTRISAVPCSLAPSGLATLCVTLLSAFQKAEYQTRRALLFVLLGLWGVVPMLHGWALNGGAPEVTRALLLDVVMGAIYIVSRAPSLQ